MLRSLERQRLLSTASLLEGWHAAEEGRDPWERWSTGSSILELPQGPTALVLQGFLPQEVIDRGEPTLRMSAGRDGRWRQAQEMPITQSDIIIFFARRRDDLIRIELHSPWSPAAVWGTGDDRPFGIYLRDVYGLPEPDPELRTYQMLPIGSLLEKVCLTGWHPVESDGRAWWVWSTGDSTLSVPPEFARLMLNVHMPTPALRGGDRTLSVYALRGDGWQLIKEAPISSAPKPIILNKGDARLLRLKTSDPWTPAAAAGDHDPRTLGVGLSDVQFMPENVDLVVDVHTIQKIYGPRFLTVRIDTTNKCNLRCQMCYLSYDQVFFQKADYMSVDVFRRIAEKAFPYAEAVVLSAGFEPLLHKDFDQILRNYLKTYNRRYHNRAQASLMRPR